MAEPTAGACTLKGLYVLTLIAALSLTACASDKQTKPIEAAVVGLPGHAAFDAAAREDSAEDKALDARLAAAEAVIHGPTFSELPSKDQYTALSNAARLAIARDHLKLGYGYLMRAAGMPEVGYEIQIVQVWTAVQLGIKDDAVAGLTTIATRWPDQLSNVPMD